MLRRLLTHSAGVLALVCATGMPCQLFAQHGRGVLPFPAHPQVNQFRPGFSPQFLGPRFGGFSSAGFDPLFIGPGVGGFSPSFGPLFIGPSFGGPNPGIDPRFLDPRVRGFSSGLNARPFDPRFRGL